MKVICRRLDARFESASGGSRDIEWIDSGELIHHIRPTIATPLLLLKVGKGK